MSIVWRIRVQVLNTVHLACSPALPEHPSLQITLSKMNKWLITGRVTPKQPAVIKRRQASWAAKTVLLTGNWWWPPQPKYDETSVWSHCGLWIGVSGYQPTWLRNMTRSWMVFDSWDGWSLKSSRLAWKWWYCCRNCGREGKGKGRGVQEQGSACKCMPLTNFLSIW